MRYLWQMFLGFMLDERGEDAPADAGSGDGAPGDAGAGDAPPDNQDGQDGGEGGAGDQPPAKQPKYGEFGDDPTPDQIFEAYQKRDKEFNDFRTKAGLTEGNLAKTRQFLKSVGLVEQKDGTWSMPNKETPQERKARFTDNHKKLWHPDVFSSMEAYVQDKIEEAFSGYGKHQTQQKQWADTLSKSIDKMFKLYPMLQSEIDGKPNPTFNKALFDRAQEILNESYRDLSNGDLLAAHEAALELNISPIAIEKARVQGAAAAAGNKRILGPAGSGGKSGASGKQLTKEQYMALSDEDKKKYDEQQVLKK